MGKSRSLRDAEHVDTLYYQIRYLNDLLFSIRFVDFLFFLVRAWRSRTEKSLETTRSIEKRRTGSICLRWADL